MSDAMNLIRQTEPGEWLFRFAGCAADACQALKCREYDEELEDVRSILADVCGALQSCGAEFIVKSPELGAWPVDGLDLAVFLEQVPEFIQFLKGRGGDLFRLDFYEQGIQMNLELRRNGDVLAVTCSSFGGEVYSEHSICSLTKWREMTIGLLNDFYSTAAVVAPSHVRHPWWIKWVEAST
jgi:hypothetical protein